jgi:hypothetical protein
MNRLVDRAIRHGALACALWVSASAAIDAAAAADASAAWDAAPQDTASRPVPLSPEASRLLRWVKRSGDHGGSPFIVIDKRRAHLWLFDPAGQLLGHTPVLLGAAPGDHSVPGIGERELADIQPHERTTPAGRFVAEAGRNTHGEDIFWLDYDAAVSMHRVRAVNRSERRLQRLASPTPADNRISYGCVNLPVAFYDTQVRPRFTAHGGVVYLLPDTLPLHGVFGALDTAPRSR